MQGAAKPTKATACAPTSTSARAASFQPEIDFGDGTTRLSVEQAAAVAPERLGQLVGHLTLPELAAVDAALVVVFGLDRSVQPGAR